jgi:hypothetical protein
MSSGRTNIDTTVRMCQTGWIRDQLFNGGSPFKDSTLEQRMHMAIAFALLR